MKLDYVEVSGFRGIRDKVRIDFGSGFTIISGRNGVGKSTLFDAVEFAVLGELGKYAVESSAKETVKDYIWWRGEGAPEAYYVTAGFRGNEGEVFSVTRTREGGANRTPEELEAALCHNAVPENPLRQLCKTTIIRDDWISALSLDLTETQRFDLVRAALGSIEGADLAARAKTVVGITEATCDRAEQAYEQARAQLSGSLVQLSEASDAAARKEDLSAAITVLDSFVPTTAGDLGQRLDIAARELPVMSRRLTGMGEAIFQGRELELYRAQCFSKQAVERREQIKARLNDANSRLGLAMAAIERAQRDLDTQLRLSELGASLSILVEHGEAIGLHDEHCPLCDAHRTPNEFSEGIARARARIDEVASGTNAAHEALTIAKANAEEPARISMEIDAEWRAEEQLLEILRLREEAHVELFTRYGLDFKLATDIDELERQASIERDGLIEFERALNTLNSSQAIGRVSALDSRVSTLRQQVDLAADALARAQRAVAQAKSLEKSVRRSSSEIVDERLALISPLLNELYQRLRPHLDWRSIEYSIRGDVRRFLSLKVGDDLNPQFVFSSGQRRAAGLAFLLSVHLARPWAKWDSLLLDDPVQHIDDFRALNLVEVLAAFRTSGRQVICAVEDEALGDLLCRRLQSTFDQPGRRYTIDLAGRGSVSVERTEILPMPLGVLRSSSGHQAAS